MGKINMDDTEKVYVTRDEDSDLVFVWKKPIKGNFEPTQIKNCDTVNFNREDINNVDYYVYDEFVSKFNITINHKSKKHISLPVSLLNNEDYKMISKDKDRKR
jgi:hypothetical protein